MRRAGSKRGKDGGAASIGELMLAKTVIEEKNVLLDQKDEQIRRLRSREQVLGRRLAEAEEQLEGLEGEKVEAEAQAYGRGRREAVAEVVRLAAEYAQCGQEGSGALAGRLIGLFREKYGLQVIDRVASGIDPEVHQVLEVVRGEQGPGAEVVSRGYRMEGKLIRPALVKVFEEPPKGA
jgi:molecular chaperone GrpE (heat shock protein)